MFVTLFILLLLALCFMLSVEAGRLKNKGAALLCITGASLTPIPFMVYVFSGGEGFISGLIYTPSLLLELAALSFCANLFIAFLSNLVLPPREEADFKRIWGKRGKTLITIILPALFICYHLFDQSDRGGNRDCYLLSDINIEKDYGGEFLPVYEFMPNPYLRRFKFRLRRQDYARLRSDLEKRGYRLFDSFYYPGTDIAAKGADESISYHKTSSLNIWLYYHSTEEVLYIGGFHH